MPKHTVHVCQQNLFEIEAVPKNPKPSQKSENNYIFDIIDSLNSPVLTFSESWADTIPKRILDIIPLSRMTALMKGEQLATYAECVVYIYTRTLEAPMHSEWADIYTHVGCKTCQEWFGENHWDEVKAPRELTDWLQSKLDDLRRHIYNKRREILKQRLRSEEENTEKPNLELLKRSDISQQRSLFPY